MAEYIAGDVIHHGSIHEEQLSAVGKKALGLIVTNADRIRAMSDEELAEEISEFMPCSICPIDFCKARTNSSMNNCVMRWLDWLKSPAGETT